MVDASPDAPAGWYPVAGGGKRFWNGYRWTTDVIGAPSPEAEYAAMDPYLPAPTVVLPTEVYERSLAPVHQSPAATPPGWYPSPSGAMQWWDGRAWGPFAPPGTVQVRTVKESGIAYLFWFLLGGFGAHRFYLGLTGTAVVLLILWVGGWLLSPLVIGIPMLVAGGIWLIVDLFLIPTMVRDTNTKRGYY